MDQRSRAHSTGLDGDVELAIEQSMVAEGCSGITKGNNLGVGTGVLIGEIAVISSPDHLAGEHHDRADRNLTRGFCFSRLFEREPHELFT